jgi:hypothetical protein
MMSLKKFGQLLKKSTVRRMAANGLRDPSVLVTVRYNHYYTDQKEFIFVNRDASLKCDLLHASLATRYEIPKDAMVISHCSGRLYEFSFK